MIQRVILRNLKRFREQEFVDLAQLHLLVGPNNAGKSTLLQALAIWNYCVEEFRASARTGSKAIELTLANFTPVPLNDFKLLWHEKTERHYPVTGELDPVSNKPKRKQEFIPVEIEVHWRGRDGREHSFTVSLRWHNQNTLYATPKGGWEEFRRLDGGNELASSAFPRVVYLPPHSNISARETPLDDANLRALVGEGRSGSVVRNLVFRAWRAEKPGPGVLAGSAGPFTRLRAQVAEWFGVEVLPPVYEEGRSRYVASSYRTAGGVELDWVNAGSGLLQCLIVLAFLHSFQPDVLLLDEPDAHLHVNLQRSLLGYLLKQTRTQMLIATHAEEFIQRVHRDQISFLTPAGVRRIPDAGTASLALSEISNLEIGFLLDRRLMLYVEGETDAECLRGWARALAKVASFSGLAKFAELVGFHFLKGGSPEEMLEAADRHFQACRFLSPPARRLLVLDRNDGKWQSRIGRDEQLCVWNKRHIESYLLAPAAWRRAAEAGAPPQWELASVGLARTVADFFAEISGGREVDWLNNTSELFRDLNAKRILFEARSNRGADGLDALSARLYQAGVVLTREDVAAAMLPEEIHADIKNVFALILNSMADPTVPPVTALR